MHDGRHLRYSDRIQASGRADTHCARRETHVVQADYVLRAGGRMQVPQGALWAIHS